MTEDSRLTTIHGSCSCGVRHRKWSTIAKCRWPRNIWIIGNGRWATVAYCVAQRAWEPYFGRTYVGSQTVMLHPTRDDAEHSLWFIGLTGCGGVCHGAHELVDLAVTACAPLCPCGCGVVLDAAIDKAGWSIFCGNEIHYSCDGSYWCACGCHVEVTA